MKIQYCSDLHLEFSSNKNWIENNPIEPVGDILLVAGDTFLLGDDFIDQRWFDYASDNWQRVILIPGNHEFYRGYDAKLCLERDFRMEIRSNVHMYNNAVVEIEDVRIILSTMWSKVLKEPMAIMNGMNDFRLIQVNGEKLNIRIYNELYEYSWSFLKEEINKKSKKKKVVITHHLPSERCNLPIYEGSRLNEAFCVNLNGEIEKSDVHFWVYGHSHGNLKDFKIGQTTLVTNQLGYVDAEEHYKFDARKCFEI